MALINPTAEGTRGRIKGFIPKSSAQTIDN
jgi:hypothetical protein